MDGGGRRAQSKERKGQILQRSGAKVKKPKGPNTYDSKNPVTAIWQPCLDRPLRINPDDDAVGALLPHLPADAGRRAAGAGAHHDHVHLAVALLEDLLGRSVVVGQRVTGVAVLRGKALNL